MFPSKLFWKWGFFRLECASIQACTNLPASTKRPKTQVQTGYKHLIPNHTRPRSFKYVFLTLVKTLLFTPRCGDHFNLASYSLSKHGINLSFSDGLCEPGGARARLGRAAGGAHAVRLQRHRHQMAPDVSEQHVARHPLQLHCA